MTKREIFEQLLTAYAIAKSNAEYVESRHNDEIRDILHDIILDLAVPEEKPEAEEVRRDKARDLWRRWAEGPVEEKKEGRDIWSWYDCPGRDKNGRKCDKTDCRSCPFRPANTIPACDWPTVEQAEVPYKGVEKIVDPTGKNPTSYKCPFCNSYTITKTYRDIAGYLDGTCDHCGRTFTLTGEEKIL